MNETLAIFSMCFALLFLIEGIDTAITSSKANIAYKVTHILYPLFIFGTQFYFLVSGVMK